MGRIFNNQVTVWLIMRGDKELDIFPLLWQISANSGVI
jgi:hypothetical protein